MIVYRFTTTDTVMIKSVITHSTYQGENVSYLQVTLSFYKDFTHSIKLVIEQDMFITF